MEKWCIKPENEEQLIIICKWFDENYSHYEPGFYQDLDQINYYLTYGMGKGNVYYSTPQNRKLTWFEFNNEILNKNVEPVYDIY